MNSTAFQLADDESRVRNWCCPSIFVMINAHCTGEGKRLMSDKSCNRFPAVYNSNGRDVRSSKIISPSFLWREEDSIDNTCMEHCEEVQGAVRRRCEQCCYLFIRVLV